jgi:alpha-D-ribose 1-methylphosphonate 5-triphosphate synthase subunit PhnG
MTRVRETVDGEVFNLGEVLVTRCEVLLDGEPGWAVVVGEDPERALCGAALDAARRNGMPPDVEEELALQLALAREARRERWTHVQPTRADFREVPS